MVCEGFTETYMSSNTTRHYDENAAEFFERYRSLTTPDVLGAEIVHVPARPSLVLDVGSGSGRDSNWLAGRGHVVVAVEPSEGLRTLAVAAGQHLRVVNYDSILPDLAGLDGFSSKFDFVLCSAVWMHLRHDERSVAARRLHSLMKDGAKALVTFKVAPEEPGRAMFSIDPDVAKAQFEDAGFKAEMTERTDLLGRDGTRWFTVVLERP